MIGVPIGMQNKGRSDPVRKGKFSTDSHAAYGIYRSLPARICGGEVDVVDSLDGRRGVIYIDDNTGSQTNRYDPTLNTSSIRIARFRRVVGPRPKVLASLPPGHQKIKVNPSLNINRSVSANHPAPVHSVGCNANAEPAESRSVQGACQRQAQMETAPHLDRPYSTTMVTAEYRILATQPGCGEPMGMDMAGGACAAPRTVSHHA